MNNIKNNAKLQIKTIETPDKNNRNSR